MVCIYVIFQDKSVFIYSQKVKSMKLQQHSRVSWVSCIAHRLRVDPQVVHKLRYSREFSKSRLCGRGIFSPKFLPQALPVLARASRCNTEGKMCNMLSSCEKVANMAHMVPELIFILLLLNFISCKKCIDNRAVRLITSWPTTSLSTSI